MLNLCILAIVYYRLGEGKLSIPQLVSFLVLETDYLDLSTWFAVSARFLEFIIELNSVILLVNLSLYCVMPKKSIGREQWHIT